MEDYLGSTITKDREMNIVKGIKITSELASTTHQQFVDDIILFGHGGRQDAHAFKNILDSYSKASG